MIPSDAWRYWRLKDPFCSDAATTGASKIVNAFEWPGQPSKIDPSSSNFVIPSTEDRLTAMYKNGIDRACGSGVGDMLADK